MRGAAQFFAPENGRENAAEKRQGINGFMQSTERPDGFPGVGRMRLDDLVILPAFGFAPTVVNLPCALGHGKIVVTVHECQRNRALTQRRVESEAL